MLCDLSRNRIPSLRNALAHWIWLIGILSAIAPLFGQTIPERLDLQTAVAIALESHPLLDAASAEVSAQEGLIRQSSFRPNPAFTLQTENWRFTGDPSFDLGSELDVFAYVTQPLERKGKRDRRVEVASSRQEKLRLSQALTAWRLRQEVKAAFWQAMLAQTELGILKENLRLFAQITEFNRVRVQEGATAEVDLIRVELEEQRLRIVVEEAAAELDRRKHELVRAMGREEQYLTFELVGEPVQGLRPGGEGPEALTVRALGSRLEVQLARVDVEEVRTRLRLEEARAKPDWDLIFGYKRGGGFNTILAGVSVPLTLFDKNEGNILFQSRDIERAEAMVRVASAEVRADVAAALAGLNRRARILQEVENNMVGRAEETWNIGRAAYEEGAASLLVLIDAQRSRNEITLLRNRAVHELQVDLIQLENAIGEEAPPVGMESLSLEK